MWRMQNWQGALPLESAPPVELSVRTFQSGSPKARECLFPPPCDQITCGRNKTEDDLLQFFNKVIALSPHLAP